MNLKKSSPSQKRVLITGAAGFIGFHLARFLLKRGSIVCGCDHFNDYYDPHLKHQRANLLKEEDIEIADLDICDRIQIEKLIKDKEITHIVHLAAQAGVRYSIKHPEKYVHSNINGFMTLLELLRSYPKIKFIYASSSSVYGLNQKIPFSETDATLQPANFYAATKIFNEAMAHSYHHLYGLSVTGLRFFTVYGPWGRPDMAYYSFTKAILNEEPISVYHQGKMKRDFTYIDDIVQGIAAAIDLAAECEVFNLGNHHPENLLTLIHYIERYTGKKAKINYLPQPKGEVEVTYADISKSQNRLGFSPKTSLEEGMKQFVDWYLEYSQTKTCI